MKQQKSKIKPSVFTQLQTFTHQTNAKHWQTSKGVVQEKQKQNAYMKALNQPMHPSLEQHAWHASELAARWNKIYMFFLILQHLHSPANVYTLVTLNPKRFKGHLRWEDKQPHYFEWVKDTQCKHTYIIFISLCAEIQTSIQLPWEGSLPALVSYPHLSHDHLDQPACSRQSNRSLHLSRDPTLCNQILPQGIRLHNHSSCTTRSTWCELA